VFLHRLRHERHHPQKPLRRVNAERRAQDGYRVLWQRIQRLGDSPGPGGSLYAARVHVRLAAGGAPSFNSCDDCAEIRMKPHVAMRLPVIPAQLSGGLLESHASWMTLLGGVGAGSEATTDAVGARAASWAARFLTWSL
jgi:hypothetical protein